MPSGPHDETSQIILMIDAQSSFPKSKPKTSALAFGLLSMLLIGFLDYRTGPQISSSLFYLLPILFITHYYGRRLGIVAAIFSATLWFLADVLPPHQTTLSNIDKGLSIPIWNAFMRTGVFLIVVWLLSAMRRLNDSLEQRVEERTEQLRREGNERRELEKRILEVSEREQVRMGQDLHDGLCQHLIGTAFAANLLQQRLADKGILEAGEVGRIANLLDDAITQARQLVRGLYPVRIEELGLVIALEELAEISGNIYQIPCGFEMEGDPPKLSQLVSVHLYRIIQEAVTNAMKHAQPSHVWIRVRSNPDELQLRVDDDGIGMPETTQTGTGLGLKIMEFRVRMIHGQLQIKRRFSGGTTVICILSGREITA